MVGGGVGFEFPFPPQAPVSNRSIAGNTISLMNFIPIAFPFDTTYQGKGLLSINVMPSMQKEAVERFEIDP